MILIVSDYLFRLSHIYCMFPFSSHQAATLNRSSCACSRSLTPGISSDNQQIWMGHTRHWAISTDFNHSLLAWLSGSLRCPASSCVAEIWEKEDRRRQGKWRNILENLSWSYEVRIAPRSIAPACPVENLVGFLQSMKLRCNWTASLAFHLLSPLEEGNGSPLGVKALEKPGQDPGELASSS